MKITRFLAILIATSLVGTLAYAQSAPTYRDPGGNVSAAQGVFEVRPTTGWSYAAAASGIVNTTTAVTFKAAAGAGLKNYITSVQITAEALGAATELAIRDGAGGTVLWRTKIGTGGMTTGLPIVFPVPIAGTANTLLEVVTLTASTTGAVYFNAQGYTGP